MRGEGEAIFVNLVRAIDKGTWRQDRPEHQGHRLSPRKARSRPRRRSRRSPNLDSINPDWGVLEWEKYIYIPTGTRVAIPNLARGCPFTCSFCSQWKFWRNYRIRDPKKVVDEIETLVRDL